MADVDKAEKLAAARRRLEDFQKSKKKPEISNQAPIQTSDQFTVTQNFGYAATVPQNSNNISFAESNNGTHPPATPLSPESASQPAGFRPGVFPTLPQDVQVAPEAVCPPSEAIGNTHNTQLRGDPSNPESHAAYSPRMFNASAFLDSSKRPWDSSDWLHSMTPSDSKPTASTFPPQQPGMESSDTLPQHSVNSPEEVNKIPPFSNGSSASPTIASPNVEKDRNSVAVTSGENFLRNERDQYLSENMHQAIFNGRSSSENLRILASQMTKLCDDERPANSSQPSTSSLSVLEARIQDLNAQLAAERSNNQQLQIYLKESQARCVQLETKVSELRTESEVTLAQRIGPLQEQLRAHAQTVGILVGEKTELEAALAHHIATAEQRSGEMDELQSRLRASRHKVNELEKELANKVTKAQTNDRQVQIFTQEQDRLKRENLVLSKQLEDVKEEASELRQKLNAKVTEASNLENSLEEQQKQLSLAQLRVTQLSGVESPLMTSELEALHQHKFSLEKRCSELTETLRVMGVERDQAAEQYQQYVTQLNSQLQSLNQKMDQLITENGSLRKREQELVQAMSELERQLQQSKKAQLPESEQQSAPQPIVESKEYSELSARVEALQLEKAELTKTVEEKDESARKMQSEIEDFKAQISELEILKGDEPDQARLLAAMESDKVAAAQATAQNAKLKDQVEELQEAFIKISNDKLQLTDDLEKEKRVNSNMGEKVASLAEELHELRLLVAQRNRELEELRSEHHDHNHDDDHFHSKSNHEQSNDPDSHGHNRLHNHSHDHRHDHHHHHDHDHDHDHNHAGDHYNSHKNDVKQFTDSNDAGNDSTQRPVNEVTDSGNIRCLLPQKSTESHESGSSSSVTEGATTDDGATDGNGRGCIGSHGMHSSYLSMQGAMEQLQARFTRTITELAELADEKQRLEHLVLQLQGETETIGEYVALYQVQRAALQQRARDKDHQLACLAEERETLRKKLADLSGLVCQLVEEKKLLGLSTDKESVVSNNVQDSKDEQIEEQQQSSPAVKAESADTAGQILALLNEIGTSSLVEKIPENFHPCPWCSGRLITV